MGLFSKKREESTVTPLQGSRPESPALVFDHESEPTPVPAPKLEVTAAPRPEASPTAAPKPSPKAAQASVFGIQNAMELMRKLPPDNIALVVSVVKTTLESLDIDVESIILDAKTKRDKIAERISGLEAEIADLEEEVAARREEIKSLRDDAAETKLVQERLQLASGESPAVAAAPSSFGKPEPASPLLRPPAV